MTTLRGRWVMLLVLSLIRISIAFQFQSISAIGPIVLDELAIDHALLGTLVGLFMLPGVVISPLAGLSGQRFGDKRVALVGLAMMVGGGLWVAETSSYHGACVARVICGSGGVLLNVVLTKMVTDWFTGREIVIAMAIFLSSWPIGNGLALALLPVIANRTSSDLTLASTAIVSGAALILTAAVYRPPRSVADAPAGFRFALSRREWLLAMLSGLVWAFYNVGFIAVLVFGPGFLMSTGLSVEQAGARISLAAWTVVVSLPVGGIVAARLGSRDLVIAASLLAMALFAVSLPLGLSPTVACLAIGLMMGLPGGLIVALPAESLQPANRMAGMGLFYTFYYAGMAGLVPAVGLLRDLTGDDAAPMWGAGGIMLLAVVSLGGFRLVRRL